MEKSYSRDTFSSSADKLRSLLDSVQSVPKNTTSSMNYISNKYNFSTESIPKIEDLLRLMQSTENMNQQLINENRFLKDEINTLKLNLMQLIEENTYLHSELKNVTVHEILLELENDKESQHNNMPSTTFENLVVELKQKSEKLNESQRLINDLQKKLMVTGKTSTSQNEDEFEFNENQIANDQVCLKCGGTNDLEVKRREIDNLKRNNEQLSSSLEYMRTKLDEMKSTENESYLQIKKYSELVKHLEMERDQALMEKNQHSNDNVNLKKKIEEFIAEYNQNLLKDKEVIEQEFQEHNKKLFYQNQISENIIAKNEALIDRLTRDKTSLTTELEEYKTKYNSVDSDTQQISLDRLRNQYKDILKERDVLLLDLKRVRHDYDLYVKQNDQEKFCLRDELNKVRNRLLDIEHEFLKSKEQIIEVTEENNKLQAEIISCKHAKETVEASRLEGFKSTIEEYKNREIELANAIVQLQTLHCVKIKELEDLTDFQRKLIDKLRGECKNLTSHMEESQSKHSVSKQDLCQRIEELTFKINKYEHTSRELEEQNIKHVDLEERLKNRLKELTLKAQQQHEQIQRLSSKETKLELNNQQLICDLAEVRKQLAMYAVPTKMQMLNKVFDTKSQQNNLLNI